MTETDNTGDLILGEFVSSVSVRTTPPFGYDKDGNPVIEELAFLQQAFNEIEKGLSLRQVLPKLNEQLGTRQLSLMGLSKLFKQYRPKFSKTIINRKDPKYRKQEKKTLAEKALSTEQKEEIKLRRKIAAEKRRITAAQKRIDALSGQKEQSQETQEIISTHISSPVIESQILVPELVERKILFKPNSGPQEEFLSAPELEVLYGGAAGGGKTYSMIADPMRFFEKKGFAGILFRRTNDELREVKWKTKELYPQIFPNAKWSEKDSEWRFSNGGRLWLTYLDRDDDLLRYQGQAFTWIGFDELTHWPTPYPWDYMRSRLRTTSNSDIGKNELFMRGTTNPGGPGHGWVKKMFIDPAPPNKPFWAVDIETNEPMKDPETGEFLFRRRFIPARLEDNPYLAEDGVYRRNLASLGDRRRKQLLEGSWDVADGAEFSEFNAKVHVIEPFEIPRDWTRFRSMDYGYSSHTAVHWFAINPKTEQLVVYRELYVSKKTGAELAKLILDLEKEERVSYGVLDSSVWHKRGEGPSVAEVMISHGCRWRPSDRSAGSRVAGKDRLHELLKLDEITEQPGIVFFNTCRQIVTTLPIIPADPKGDDDIDKRFRDDHAYDSVRYGVMSRPRSDYGYYNNNSSFSPSVSVDNVFGY